MPSYPSDNPMDGRGDPTAAPPHTPGPALLRLHPDDRVFIAWALALGVQRVAGVEDGGNFFRSVVNLAQLMLDPPPGLTAPRSAEGLRA